MAAVPPPPSHDGEPSNQTGSAVYAWYVLLLLTVTYAIHTVDRSVINVLVEPIKREFHINDGAIGLMTGPAYAVAFAVAGLPLGILVDRVRRQRLLAALLLVWSALTALGGLTSSFATLAATRAAVGAAESGSPPTALSLVSDYFPPRVRALAVSVFFIGAPIGAVAGVYFAALITAAHGWRAALFAAGAPGVVVSVLIFLTVREPKRGALDAAASDPAPPFSAVFRLILGDRGLTLIMLALILGAMAQVGIGSWMPAVLMRAYHLPVARMGAVMGLSGLCGAAGTALGGFLSNAYAKGRAERLLRIAGVSFLCGVPFTLLVMLSASHPLNLAPVLLAAAITPIYYGPGFSLALGLAPAPMRGRMMAVTLVMSNILGAGLGPQFIGWISDALSARGDPLALPHAVACLGVAAVLTGLLFLSATRYVTPGLTQPIDPE